MATAATNTIAVTKLRWRGPGSRGLAAGLTEELAAELGEAPPVEPFDELAGSGAGAGAEGGAIKVFAELVGGRLGHGKILQLQSTHQP